jgi:hypothetical protein
MSELTPTSATDDEKDTPTRPSLRDSPNPRASMYFRRRSIAAESQSTKAKKVEQLGVITNSTAFRDASSELIDESELAAAYEELDALVASEQSQVAATDLVLKKRLGEGAFATVELREFKPAGDAPAINVAVKVTAPMRLPSLDAAIVRRLRAA